MYAYLRANPLLRQHSLPGSVQVHPYRHTWGGLGICGVADRTALQTGARAARDQIEPRLRGFSCTGLHARL